MYLFFRLSNEDLSTAPTIRPMWAHLENTTRMSVLGDLRSTPLPLPRAAPTTLVASARLGVIGPTLVALTRIGPSTSMLAAVGPSSSGGQDASHSLT